MTNTNQTEESEGSFRLERADEPQSSASASGYRVLARKYRPTSFADLKGQEAMVRTLTNGFKLGRIPQAWMLTGVRGVGKTTTARILSRGLNYERDDGSINAPTIEMPSLGVHCKAIMEGRHPDVFEMDAASHTGINDIREIIDQVRYRPSSARFKVYLIDEVHMLSTQAFNGLLKTLEEPPEHVKFIFATTEIRKVPITVLSRCQRFDLRRIEADVMIAHLKDILAQEGLEAEDEALSLVVRAGEGSARDCLSLLDQAIAMADGIIGADVVRAMLGLADRARLVDLFQHLMAGEMTEALELIGALYQSGADPSVILSDLAGYTHYVTRLKLAPSARMDAVASEVEREQGASFAEKLSIRVLGRTWQILTQGLEETKAAPDPLASAEMVLIRLGFAADLPTPDEALKRLKGASARAPSKNAATTDNTPAASPASGQPAGQIPTDPLSANPALTASHLGSSLAGSLQAGSPQAGPPEADSPQAVSAETRVQQTRAQQAGLPQENDRQPHAPLSSQAMGRMASENETKAATPMGRVQLSAVEGGLAGSANRVAAPPKAAPVAPADGKPPAMPSLRGLSDVVALAAQNRDLWLKDAIETYLRPIRFDAFQIEVEPTSDAPVELTQKLTQALQKWTGSRWSIIIGTDGGETLAEAKAKERSSLVEGARANPAVAALLAAFPGAQIVDVRVPAPLDEDADAAFDQDPVDDEQLTPDDWERL